MHTFALLALAALAPAAPGSPEPPRFWYNAQGKSGFLDRQGKVAIQARYDWVDEWFQGPLCRASVNKKMGLIDRRGRWVVPPRYYRLSHPVGGRIVVNDSRYRVALANRKGMLLTPFRYSTASCTPTGECLVAEKGRYSILGPNLRPIIPAIYDSLTHFNTRGLAVARRGGALLLIDRTGRTVKTLPYDSAAPRANGLITISLKKKQGLLDDRGSLVLAPKYDEIWWFSEGLAAVRSGLRYGYIDGSGREIIAPKWQYGAAFLGGLAAVRDDKTYRFGYIDRRGKLVIPHRFTDARGFDTHGLAVVTVRPKNYRRPGPLHGYSGIIDKRGRYVVKPVHDQIWAFSDGLALFETGSVYRTTYCMRCRRDLKESSRYGYLNLRGKVVIPAIYAHGTPFRDGLAAVMKDYRRRYIDTRGRTVWKQTP